MSDDKQQAAIQEKLNDWRENAKHMYERLDTVSLDWPSLTAQWVLDDKEGQRAFVATYSLGADREYVREVDIDTDKLGPDQHQVQSWPAPEPSKEELDRKSEGQTYEVQKLRQCPLDLSKLAAFAAHSGTVFIYDRTSPGSAPVAALAGGHASSGFGLAWSPVSKTELVSGADDGKIILWDTASKAKKHEIDTGTIVNELTWDHEQYIVASLETGHVLILSPQLETVADLSCHTEGVNTAQLSPFAPHLLATGASDKRIKLWDIRRPHDRPLYENFAHEGNINCVRWSPHVDGVLASTAMDCVVYLWDLRNIGKDQPHEDVEDGAPELLFKHNGHINGDQVQDIDWHPSIELLLLSCDGRNVLMSWKPNKEILEAPEAPPMPSFLI